MHTSSGRSICSVMSGQQAYRAAAPCKIRETTSCGSSGPLQPPVDGVGEADNFPGGLVGCPLWPLPLRRLAGDLIQQDFVPQGDDSAALDAFQVQGIALAVRAAHPMEGRAAGGTAQTAGQFEGRPLCFGRLLCRFLPDAALDTVESFTV